jgi:hypothetical protein
LYYICNYLEGWEGGSNEAADPVPVQKPPPSLTLPEMHVLSAEELASTLDTHKYFVEAQGQRLKSLQEIRQEAERLKRKTDNLIHDLSSSLQTTD